MARTPSSGTKLIPAPPTATGQSSTGNFSYLGFRKAFSSFLAEIKLCQERSKARGWSGFAPKRRGCSAPSCQAGPFGGSRCHLGDGKDLVTRIWEAPPASRGKIRDEDCFKCCTARRESPIVPDHGRTGKPRGPQTAGRKNLIRPFLNLCFLFFSFSA